MSRLIVLSNRVKLPDNNPMAGGLALAMHDVLKENSGIWMGWNGNIMDEDHDVDHKDLNFTALNFSELDTSHSELQCEKGQLSKSKLTYMTTALTSHQYQHYYCGFTNNVLWPMLHEQADLISQAPHDYDGYQSVNRLFAKQLSDVCQPEDVIWVHDYHFLSVAYHCRQLGMRNRIGFFLHIPFAPLSYWQQLDKSAELIEHLAHYDIVGTQTHHDNSNCLDVFRHYLKKQLSTPFNSQLQISVKGRGVNTTGKAQTLLNLNLKNTDNNPHCLIVKTYPIGINVAKIQQQVHHLNVLATLHNKNKKSTEPVDQSVKQIIAVDRIDYSKGLLERFTSYADFLQQYPRYQNQLKFLQIACPSRLDLPAYRCLYEKVRHTVQYINQQFFPSRHTSASKQTTNSSIANEVHINNSLNDAHDIKDTDNKSTHWQAITYSEKVLTHKTLMTEFWHSDVGWVNSLKDGMNLVAKEYIAAQNPDNPGVLVLSCYAGAAEQMQEAVIIDPKKPDSVIQGLKTALEMPLDERKARHDKLLKGLKQHTLHDWQQAFLDDLYGLENDKLP